MKTPDSHELNKSIHIKNEEFCLKKYPEFTNHLMQLYPNCNHIERLYRYFHKDWDNRCKNCGRTTKFISFLKGYSKYCSPGCASKDNDVKKQKKLTTLKHYGVENPSQSKDVILKKKNTLRVKYGDENYNNRERAKQTCLERYGDEKFNNLEKSKQTCLERYGTEHFLSDLSVISRINETCKKKYGGRGNASKILKDKMKNTCLERYGDENYNNREKAKSTMLAYYGAETYKRLTPHKETNIELFITNILDKYNISYKKNDRIVLNGKELDVYIPSKNIAIECNGCYWHDDEHKSNNYHFKKFKECQDKGIQLITIWDDQIHRCGDIIESIIKSKLNIYERKIYARQCLIKNIDSKKCKEFLVNNHLQGAVNSSIKYGLFYKDELVAVMTFGKNRKCVNGGNGWELYRYCTKLNTIIIGGASKLFNYFVKENKPDYITSFSSNDISNGSLYKFLNFKQSSQSVSYWYIKNNKRYHRFNFTKSKLVESGYDQNMSEREIMISNNYHRIYDSGQTKWEWQIFNNA